VGSPLFTYTSAPFSLSGRVPENKMMGTSGLIFFISLASSAPVFPCSMWSAITAQTGDSRRACRASSVVVTPITLYPSRSRTFFRSARYVAPSSTQRMSGFPTGTGRFVRNVCKRLEPAVTWFHHLSSLLRVYIQEKLYCIEQTIMVALKREKMRLDKAHDVYGCSRGLILLLLRHSRLKATTLQHSPGDIATQVLPHALQSPYHL
jgi:hypothetical protein